MKLWFAKRQWLEHSKYITLKKEVGHKAVIKFSDPSPAFLTGAIFCCRFNLKSWIHDSLFYKSLIKKKPKTRRLYSPKVSEDQQYWDRWSVSLKCYPFVAKNYWILAKLPEHDAFLNYCLHNCKIIFNIQILVIIAVGSEERRHFWESGPNLISSFHHLRLYVIPILWEKSKIPAPPSLTFNLKTNYLHSNSKQNKMFSRRHSQRVNMEKTGDSFWGKELLIRQLQQTTLGLADTYISKELGPGLI